MSFKHVVVLKDNDTKSLEQSYSFAHVINLVLTDTLQVFENKETGEKETLAIRQTLEPENGPIILCCVYGDFGFLSAVAMAAFKSLEEESLNSDLNSAICSPEGDILVNVRGAFSSNCRTISEPDVLEMLYSLSMIFTGVKKNFSVTTAVIAVTETEMENITHRSNKTLKIFKKK